MKRKIILNSPRILEIKRKKRQTLFKKMLWIAFFIVLILIGLSFLSKWQKFNINDIQITGNKVIEVKVIEEIAREKISGKYLWIFPKTNFLIYPKQKIEDELKNKFKRIKEVSITNKNINTLEISLSERTPSYTWCGMMPPSIEDDSQKCYFLDNEGYVFDEAPYFSGDVYFKFYGINDLDTENPLGYYFFKDNFNRLVLLKNSTEKTNIKPIAFYVMENGDIKMLLKPKINNEQGPEIIFKTNADFEKIIENLQSVLTTEPMQTDFKNRYDSLLYIDLRFGNKVYYKFK